MRETLAVEDDPLWYKDAVVYQAHVRALHDSGGDGMGDFRGLTQKLDYFQQLGITALWLMPFFPSPWRDDGYDIADYTDIHPAYGALKDFQAFLREARRRGLRVITEVVINHTSDQHPWFQRARRAQPGSRWRDFYVWSTDPELYKEARIIFKDFEASNWTWDPVAKAYYWHRFYSHQPDLNFDSPHVRQAVLDVIDFWFDMGVDAVRLDAIPYLFERPGSNCENLPETHAFLKQIRAHVDAKHRNRMLLAEANQWPEDSIAYFGQGDECHMAFHFPVMPRLFMAIQMEDRYPIVEILQHTPPIPDSCQWAMFLRNHDELTLEMVTDEERDYMYRVYAQDRQMRINLGIRRRLAPLLGNDRRKIELMNALLFSLPGTPVIYYGDEIGMGDNIYLGDRNGVRTPMQWSSDRNAGFSRASPQKLYLPITSDPEYHYETLNVEAQQNNPSSLLWWMKRIIAQRKQFKAFGRGSIEFLRPENRKVLAFYRLFEDEVILVVANLSRFPQYVELDLSAMQGYTPLEVFGRTQFPLVGDAPYPLSLAGHGFYWLSLRQRKSHMESVDGGAETVPLITIPGWDKLLDDRVIARLTALLPGFLRTRRWYRSKARTIREISLRDVISIPDAASYIALIRVEYSEGDPEDYMLPVSVARGAEAEHVTSLHPDRVVANLRASDGDGVLYGAVWNPLFTAELLTAIAKRKRFRGRSGELVASHDRSFREIWGGKASNVAASVSQSEQTNTTVMYGDRLVLKLFRKLEPGVNPDLELVRHLTRKGFEHIAPFAGHLEYRSADGELMHAGILQAYVPNQGDAWNYTLDSLSRFFETALASGRASADLRHAGHPLEYMSSPGEISDGDLIGAYAGFARLLGSRTAALHQALADPSAGEDFAPEPFTDHYRQGIHHAFLTHMNRVLDLLRRESSKLSPPAADEAREALDNSASMENLFRPLRAERITAARIRIHGDFHLGQVLYTGKDVVFIDFEGEPGRSIGERRLKRSALRDVAGMLRSFQYAAYAALFGRIAGVTPRPEALPELESWAAYWTSSVGAAFLRGYMEEDRKFPLLPENPRERRILLDAFLLEKALYEVSYELNSRPDWVRIPLRGILQLLAGNAGPA